MLQIRPFLHVSGCVSGVREARRTKSHMGSLMTEQALDIQVLKDVLEIAPYVRIHSALVRVLK